MKKSTLSLIMVIFSILSTKAQLTEINPKTTDGPDKNPLKGWNSGWDSDAPETSIGFQYISWKKLEPQDDQFNWEEVEKVLNRRGSKNKHLCIRFYVDWNHKRIDAPDWLYKEKGVKLRRQGESMATDYDDPVFIAEAIEAISALAKRYNNDPRVAFIQIGTIGFWGEWHNHPVSNWRPSKETKRKIRDAYLNVFKNKKILGRYPTESVLTEKGAIGFHNDNFKPSAGSSFEDAISKNNLYLKGPIGGEQGGGISKEDFDQMFLTNKGIEMIQTGHYTFMKPGTGDYKSTENWMKMNKMMGYNYEINTIKYSENVTKNGTVTIEIDGKNKGVAPAYFNWNVQLALLDKKNEVQKILSLPNEITKWLPNQSFNISQNFSIDLDQGEYQVAIRIIQPGSDKSKDKPWRLDARNVYMEFSNEMEVVEAYWDKNILKGGWTKLASITVNESTLNVPNSLLDNMQDKIRVYPIPTNGDKVYIEFGNQITEEIVTYKLYDLNGRLLFEDKSEGDFSEKPIEINFAKSGISKNNLYILKINIGGVFVNKSIIYN